MVTMLKIKDTPLDRRYRVSKDEHNLINYLKREGFTNTELAILFHISIKSITRHLLDKDKYEEYKAYTKERKKIWYNKKSKDERSEMTKRWNESHNSYINELLNVRNKCCCK